MDPRLPHVFETAREAVNAASRGDYRAALLTARPVLEGFLLVLLNVSKKRSPGCSKLLNRAKEQGYNLERFRALSDRANAVTHFREFLTTGFDDSVMAGLFFRETAEKQKRGIESLIIDLCQEIERHLR